MGKPVVSTLVGAEGLPLLDGRFILLTDDPRLFAQHRGTRARRAARALGAAGGELVTRKDSCDARRRLGEICDDVVPRESTERRGLRERLRPVLLSAFGPLDTAP
jgi:hypothetical protein